jgi:2-hydroxychromene-2-carboxylate isomerase
MTNAISKVEFFFDPGCPWTWKTATWLRQLPIDVHWRSFRLEYLLDGPVPEQWSAAASSSAVALRLVESLAAQGRNEEIASFYVALGEQIHDQLVAQSPELVRTVARATGLSTQDLDALSKSDLDEAVRVSFRDAQSLSGPELGSPVLAVTFADGRRRAMFGPILTAGLAPTDVARMWEAALTLLDIDQFTEIKRGRGLLHELDKSLVPHVQ